MSVCTMQSARMMQPRSDCPVPLARNAAKLNKTDSLEVSAMHHAMPIGALRLRSSVFFNKAAFVLAER